MAGIDIKNILHDENWRRSAVVLLALIYPGLVYIYINRQDILSYTTDKILLFSLFFSFIYFLYSYFLFLFSKSYKRYKVDYNHLQELMDSAESNEIFGVENNNNWNEKVILKVPYRAIYSAACWVLGASTFFAILFIGSITFSTSQLTSFHVGKYTLLIFGLMPVLFLSFDWFMAKFGGKRT